MAPPDCPNPWNEAYPVSSKDEYENRREEPKGPLDQVRPNDPFEKSVQTFNEPLPKVLDPLGHWLDVPRRDPCEDNQEQRRDPGNYHRVGDWQTEEAGDLVCMLSEALFI
jgi:hypothetical protein